MEGFHSSLPSISSNFSEEHVVPIDMNGIVSHLRSKSRMVPSCLIGADRQKIVDALKRTLLEDKGRVVLLEGPRGCGKSLAVSLALAQVEQQVSAAKLKRVSLCGRLHVTQDHSFKSLVEQLGGVFPKSATESRRHLVARLGQLHQEQVRVIVTLEDCEVFAQQPKQELLYALFDLCQDPQVRIFVVLQTHTQDFLGRLEKRVESRMGARRLTMPPLMEEEAVQMVMNVMMVVDGDGRRRGEGGGGGGGEQEEKGEMAMKKRGREGEEEEVKKKKKEKKSEEKEEERRQTDEEDEEKDRVVISGSNVWDERVMQRQDLIRRCVRREQLVSRSNVRALHRVAWTLISCVQNDNNDDEEEEEALVQQVAGDDCWMERLMSLSEVEMCVLVEQVLRRQSISSAAAAVASTTGGNSSTSGPNADEEQLCYEAYAKEMQGIGYSVFDRKLFHRAYTNLKSVADFDEWPPHLIRKALRDDKWPTYLNQWGAKWGA